MNVFELRNKILHQVTFIRSHKHTFEVKYFTQKKMLESEDKKYTLCSCQTMTKYIVNVTNHTCAYSDKTPVWICP